MSTQQEFEAILADETKRVAGDILWSDDEDHSPAQEFYVQVLSETGWPVSVKGWCNPLSRKLSYTLRHAATGRIVGLDLGNVAHRNPNRELLEGTHKHRWKDRSKDKEAHAPEDITAQWDEPVAAWRQFCAEVRILHQGTLQPPVLQGEMQL